MRGGRCRLPVACAVVLSAFQTLPPEVRSTLDAKFPGWTLTPLMQPVREALLARAPGADANIISGDFDGNGRQDYAVLLEHSTPEIDETVALLASGKGFDVVSLQKFPPDRRRYLTLEKKGTHGNPHDAIAIWLVGAGGEIYTYQNGRFTSAALKEQASMDLRIRDRRGALEEIEIAAAIGLRDVRGVHAAEPARVLNLAWRPPGAAARQLFF